MNWWNKLLQKMLSLWIEVPKNDRMSYVKMSIAFENNIFNDCKI